MSKACKKYRVPYGTNCNKINNFHPKKHGCQTALSNEFEEVLVKSLDQLTDWKVPFDGYDIRCLVQCYCLSQWVYWTNLLEIECIFSRHQEIATN